MQEIKNNELKVGKGTTVLVFSAENCPACPRVEHDIKLLAKNIKAKCYLLKREKNAEVAISFNVMGFPTVLILENGKEIKRYVGNTAGTYAKKYLTKEG